MITQLWIKTAAGACCARCGGYRQVRIIIYLGDYIYLAGCNLVAWQWSRLGCCSGS